MTAGGRISGRLIGALAALLAIVIWGVWFPVTRIGIVDGDVSPMDMIVLRCSAGAIVLLPVVWKRGFKAGRAGWLGTAAILATLSGPFALFIGLGIRDAPAAHAAIFVPGTFPAIVFVLGLLLFKDASSPRRWMGLGAVMVGVLVVGWAAFQESAGAMTGYLFFHACAWMWAAYTLIVRISGLSPAHALGITHVGAALIYGPLWLAWGDSGLIDLPVDDLAFQIGYHGVLNGLVAMFLYNVAIGRLGAAEAAIFGALVPCVAAISAWPILNEAIGWPEAIALAAVSLGVFLISGAPRPSVD